MRRAIESQLDRTMKEVSPAREARKAKTQVDPVLKQKAMPHPHDKLQRDPLVGHPDVQETGIQAPGQGSPNGEACPRCGKPDPEKALIGTHEGYRCRGCGERWKP